MIDKVKFKEMFAYYDKEVVAEVIDDFISEYEAKLNQIRDNIENRNFELIRQSSHSFKGVAGTFMDPVPHRLSGELESLAKMNDFKGMTGIFNDLEKATHELASELREVRKEYAP